MRDDPKIEEIEEEVSSFVMPKYRIPTTGKRLIPPSDGKRLISPSDSREIQVQYRPKNKVSISFRNCFFFLFF
jgi:hypothetical protein